MRLRPTCVPLMEMVLFFTLVNAAAPVVNVSYSKYRGNEPGNDVTHCFGMRYAEPPLGDLRFMPPQDPVRSRQTKNANKVSNSNTLRFEPTRHYNKLSSGSNAFPRAQKLDSLESHSLKIACSSMCLRRQTRPGTPSSPSSSTCKAEASTITLDPR